MHLIAADLRNGADVFKNMQKSGLEKNNRIVQYGDSDAGTILVQMVDERELDHIDKEVQLIGELSGRKDFLFTAVKVDDWNSDLSPWPAPSVFGKQDFAGNAEKTLNMLTKDILPKLLSERGKKKNCFLGGYSLSGLFALWAAGKTDLFHGIAAASPSVWFPGFLEYIEQSDILAASVYLSLGDKEANTRNPVMSTVMSAILETEALLIEKGIQSILEWNPGNHFKDPELRTAKGFAWLLKQHCAE